VIKYGIIYDEALFGRLENRLGRLLKLDTKLLGEVIARCCEIKAEVVGQDETETGLRAILNFGHTIGHAIENSAGYGKYLHGEAISIGQVAAAKLSCDVLGFCRECAGRIVDLFRRAGLPTEIRLNLAQRAKLIAAMKLDKKVSGGEVKFVLAEEIGKVVWGQSVAEELMERVLVAPSARS
jgi:3-dehydroquinate synthase